MSGFLSIPPDIIACMFMYSIIRDMFPQQTYLLLSSNDFLALRNYRLFHAFLCYCLINLQTKQRDDVIENNTYCRLAPGANLFRL